MALALKADRFRKGVNLVTLGDFGLHPIPDMSSRRNN
jgi:hypothetical protein